MAKYGELNPWCTNVVSGPFGMQIWRTIRTLWPLIESIWYIKRAVATRSNFGKKSGLIKYLWVSHSQIFSQIVTILKLEYVGAGQPRVRTCLSETAKWLGSILGGLCTEENRRSHHYNNYTMQDILEALQAWEFTVSNTCKRGIQGGVVVTNTPEVTFEKVWPPLKWDVWHD